LLRLVSDVLRGPSFNFELAHKTPAFLRLTPVRYWR
jgi:hypothetical protein